MPQPSAGHASLMKLGIAQVESKVLAQLIP